MKCHYRTKMYKKDNSLIDVNLSLSVLKDNAGNITHFVSAQRDITEEKQAKKQREKAHAQTERINQLMAGRENRVIELKNEINTLLAELGREAKYGK